jgi:hypothetical protein
LKSSDVWVPNGPREFDVSAGCQPATRQAHSTVTIENDYNALVFRLDDLTDELVRLKLEVERRLLQEKHDGLEPNETHWVNLIAQMALPMSGLTRSLGKMAEMVLNSRRGETVFEDQQAAAPDTPS